MKVKEFIKVLQDFNPEADIVRNSNCYEHFNLINYTWGGGCEYEGEWNEENKCLSKQRAEYVCLIFNDCDDVGECAG
jgi:hypothetical protein